MLIRREFLATATCTVAAARLHVRGQSKVRVALAIPSKATGPHMPVGFVGLSYQVQQLRDPKTRSAKTFLEEWLTTSACGRNSGACGKVRHA